jgi:hypothetical protein
MRWSCGSTASSKRSPVQKAPRSRMPWRRRRPWCSSAPSFSTTSVPSCARAAVSRRTTSCPTCSRRVTPALKSSPKRSCMPRPAWSPRANSSVWPRGTSWSAPTSAPRSSRRIHPNATGSSPKSFVSNRSARCCCARRRRRSSWSTTASGSPYRPGRWWRCRSGRRMPTRASSARTAWTCASIAPARPASLACATTCSPNSRPARTRGRACTASSNRHPAGRARPASPATTSSCSASAARARPACCAPSSACWTSGRRSSRAPSSASTRTSRSPPRPAPRAELGDHLPVAWRHRSSGMPRSSPPPTRPSPT